MVPVVPVARAMRADTKNPFRENVPNLKLRDPEEQTVDIEDEAMMRLAMNLETRMMLDLILLKVKSSI